MIIVTRVNKNYLLLKTVPLPGTACPLCQVNGQMEMSFYQLQLEADWVQNTRKVSAAVFCHSCNQDVPIVRWNNELDTIYQGEKRELKVVTSFKAGRKGKFLIRLAAAFFGGIILLLAGLFVYQRVLPKSQNKDVKSHSEEVKQSTQYMASPRIGDMIQVYLIDGSGQTLYKITNVMRTENSIKAIPSHQTFAPGARLSIESVFSSQDFDPKNEKNFSLPNYGNAMLTNQNGERQGNVIMVFRK